MNKAVAALLACVLASLASQAGAQTVSPAFDAWLKARREAHARLLPAAPAAPAATVATPGLGVPHGMAVANAPAEPTAATTLETAPAVAQPAPPVPDCAVAATPAPPEPPTPEPPAPRVAHTKLSAPISSAAPLQAPTPAVPPAPVVAPPPAPPAVLAAAAPKVVVPPPAGSVRHAAPEAAPGPVIDAARMPTRDYDMAVGPRFSVATGGVDMGQYLALSRQYLRYQ